MKISKSVVFLFPVLCGCSLHQQESQKQIDDVVIETDRDYQEVSDYELTWEAIFDVENEQYYVYFYSLTCSHCSELKNYIIGKGLERGDIYFVKGTSKDRLTNDQNQLIGAENPDDFRILGYPTLALISHQKCTKNLSGVAQIKAELK